MKNLNKFVYSIILAIIMGTGCADEVPENTEKNENSSTATENAQAVVNVSQPESRDSKADENQNTTETTMKPLSADVEKQVIPNNLNQENAVKMKSASDSINAFSFDLYRKLREEDGNLFFSPYSISSALAMTYAGAKGETAQQMAKSLHFDTESDIHSAFSTLTQALNTEDSKHYQLTIANALWRQVDELFLPDFIDLLEKHYKAGKNTVDFKNETEKARQAINTWTAENTQDKIKDLIKQGILTNLTRLVLTNAIYFKGDWMFQFAEEKTQDMPFKRSKSDEVTVSMMNQKTSFLKHTESDSMQILELPYKYSDEGFNSENSLAMLIFLPKAVEGLADVEKELSAESFRQNVDKLEIYNGKINVFLPKFKLSSGFSLKQVLTDLGMVDAFDFDKADFSGMNGKKDLAISAAVHKAFVEVNEKGTEAAAATAIVMATRSVPPPPLEFRADHPFLFLIKDNMTNTVLFMGRVIDPSSD